MNIEFFIVVETNKQNKKRQLYCERFKIQRIIWGSFNRNEDAKDFVLQNEGGETQNKSVI